MFIINPYIFGTTPAFTGLLDTYTGATVAYSVRRLSGSYTGALVRIRRSSDNAEKDFYPDTNNELSLSSEDGAGTSLSSWISTDSGYIVRWYDQSGNANNAARSIAASQPRIVNAGTLETDPNNGNVAIFLDGSDDRLDLGTTLNVVQEYYQHLVFNRSSTGIHSTSLAGTEFTWIWFSNNGIYSGTETDVLHDASQTQTGDFIQTTLRDSSNNVKMWRNGSADTTKTNSGATGNYTVLFSRAGFPHNGYVQELIYWNSDQESNQSGIEANANSYFFSFLMIVTGYKFNNLNAANNAKKALKAHFLSGRPVGDYVTTEWVEVNQDPQGFYYFLGDYSPVLGNPEQFEITDVEI